ncbi:MAG TPA: hypothetical protein VJB02_01040 [Coxiellaceae bacterium]|nr:hypothetical protein [Coxiellaceae bacterium]
MGWLREKLSQFRFINLLVDFKNHPAYLGRVLLPDTYFAHNLYYYFLYFLTYFGEARKRRKMYRESFVESIHVIPKDKGYLIADFSQEKILQEAIQHSLSMYSKQRTELLTSAKKSFLKTYLLDIGSLENEIILRLAQSPFLIKPIASYFNTLPIFAMAQVWYSPNQELFPSGGSQRFHMDGEGHKHIKCFIPLKTITQDSGPLTIIPSNESRVLYKKLKAKKIIRKKNQKIPDEIMLNQGESVTVVPLTGEVGSVFFVDNCNCYHYGSRPGLDDRLVLVLQYETPYSRELPTFQKKYNSLYAGNLSHEPQKQLEGYLFSLSHQIYSIKRLKKNQKYGEYV